MRNQKNELKLLKLLEQDCTLTHAQLAAMCDMTEKDVASEIDQLERDHVILGYKAIINCRPDNDFSYYDPATKGLDDIKKVPTLLDVFGKEKAEQYNVPNTTAIICRAEVPAETVAQIKAVCDALGNVEKSDATDSFYVRQRVNGGTSKYYAFNAADIQKEWERLVPIIKEIEGK